MRRLWRDLTDAAELVGLLVVSWRYARSEKAENQRKYVSLDQMTDDRRAAESRLRRRSS